MTTINKAVVELVLDQMSRQHQRRRFVMPTISKDQTRLLVELVLSVGRGAASMSCGGWRQPVARELSDLGMIELNEAMSSATPFYTINKKGLQALGKRKHD